MSKLEKLREFVEANPTLLSYERDKIRSIADEIEDELNELRCKVECVDWRLVASELLNKPASDECQSITQWLDQWYLPRPVDADGELFDFNKVYNNGCGAIGRIVATEFSIGCGKTSVIYDIVSHDESAYSPNALRAEKPDSIDNLRKDIIEFMSKHSDIDTYHIVNTTATEWLFRAKKLFKDGGE